MPRIVVLLALLALSCGPTTRPDFVVHLVDARCNNPFQECNSGNVRVDVQQSTNATLTSNATITGTGMISSLSVQIPSYGLLTEIEVTVTCVRAHDTITLVGATPHFLPVGYGSTDVVVGRTDTCEPLSSPVLATPSVGPNLVRLHANLVAIGGVERGDIPSTHVQPIDTVTLGCRAAMVEFPRLSIGVRPGRALALGATQFIFVSDTSSGIYETAAGVTTRVSSFPAPGLYPGADSNSAVVALNGTGFAIVGGSTSAGGRVQEILWLSADGRSAMGGHLLRARRQPAAVYIGANRLLVAGGQGPGEELFELVTFGQSSSGAFGPTTETRFAPIAVADPSGTHVLVAFGTDEAGTAYTSSWALTSCAATACTYSAGPVITDPRTDVALVEHLVGGSGPAAAVGAYEALVIGGTDTSTTPTASTLIDRITLGSDGSWSITAAGGLATPRSRPGAADIGAGIVIVAGGAGDHGDPIRELEICFPPALRPVSPSDSN